MLCLTDVQSILLGEWFPTGAVSIVGVGHDDESIGSDGLDGGGESFYLAHVHHHHQGTFLLLRIEARGTERGGGTVELVQDEIAQLDIVGIGDDKHQFVALGTRQHEGNHARHDEDADERITCQQEGLRLGLDRTYAQTQYGNTGKDDGGVSVKAFVSLFWRINHENKLQTYGSITFCSGCQHMCRLLF